MILIDDLLMLPVKGFVGVFRKIHEMVEQELSEKHIQEELTALQLRFELGEINREEYDIEEEKLLEQLDVLRSDDEE
jgi:hypothetical protein